MIQIIKSLFGKTDSEFDAELQIILSYENYKLLSSDERDVFTYLSKQYKLNKQFPTEEVFLLKYSQYRFQLQETDPLSISDFRYYRKQFITKHQNIHKSKILHQMAVEAAADGISPEMAETIRRQATFETDVKEETLSFRERYTRSMKENAGLKTYIDAIDDEIGFIPKGAMCVIAGFTGSFKTTMAVNVAVKNALAGKNIAYISLEITKEQLEYSILSLFSNDVRFSRMGYSPLEHKKIRYNQLTVDEINFLCDVLEPEYRRVIEPNLHIIDNSKFKTFSESEMIDVLYSIDDERPIDAIFVDHVGELAFKSPLYNGNNVGAIINKYVSFFGALTVTFRVKDGEKRSTTTVLLAQTNRSGFKEAAASYKKLSQVTRPGNRNNQLNTQVEGYRLTALSDSNELERFASLVITVFASDAMKDAHQAYVQILKTRYGNNLAPTAVDIEPSVYKFGGDATVDESELSVDLIDSLSACSIAQKNAGTNIYIEDTSCDDFGI